MNWTEFLLAEAESTYRTTAKLMDKVDPASLSWKPAEGSKWMSVGQLLKHISNSCGAGCKGIVLGDWGLPADQRIEDLTAEQMFPPAEDLPVVESVSEAKKLLNDDRELARQMITKAGKDGWSDREIEVPWSPGLRLPLRVWLLRMIQHLDRHKSQLYYYLKLQGKPVRTKDLWGAPRA